VLPWYFPRGVHEFAANTGTSIGSGGNGARPAALGRHTGQGEVDVRRTRRCRGSGRCQDGTPPAAGIAAASRSAGARAVLGSLPGVIFSFPLTHGRQAAGRPNGRRTGVRPVGRRAAASPGHDELL
jgi:hypothetical protein